MGLNSGDSWGEGRELGGWLSKVHKTVAGEHGLAHLLHPPGCRDLSSPRGTLASATMTTAIMRLLGVLLCSIFATAEVMPMADFDLQPVSWRIAQVVFPASELRRTERHCLWTWVGFANSFSRSISIDGRKVVHSWFRHKCSVVCQPQAKHEDGHRHPYSHCWRWFGP